MASFNKPVRTFKSDPTQNAGIKFMNNAVTITGDSMTTFLTLNDKGIGLAGDVNLQAMSNQVKLGGLMTFQLTPLMMIPSTTVTPFPAVLPNLELIGKIVEVAITAVSMLALLG